MMFAPTDNAPLYYEELRKGRKNWDDPRFAKGNLSAKARKPMTHKDYRRMMQQTPCNHQ